ncbi:MAG: hypothetical protein KDK78_08435, partial [Chlamydiia bacterium]|nr:hypothetical protein [Chlamydiia bacterium]
TTDFFTEMSQAFVSVVNNSWQANDNPALPPAQNASLSLLALPLEGGGTVSAFTTLPVTNPEDLFAYWVDNVLSTQTSVPSTWKGVMQSYRDYVLSLVRTDLDTDVIQIISDFELYGDTISKFAPDDGNTLTPRVNNLTPFSDQVKTAIAKIFNGGEADIASSVDAKAKEEFDATWGPDGVSALADAIGTSASGIIKRAIKHYLQDCWLNAPSKTVGTLLDGWYDFIAASATVLDSDKSGDWNEPDIENYFDAFNTALPSFSGDEDTFLGLVRYFIRYRANQNDGYFMPGDHYAAFVAFLNEPAVQSDPTALTTGLLDCPPPIEWQPMDRIIMEILDLLVVVLNRFEETIVVQSKANLINQDVQSKYTELISKVQLKDTETIDTDDTQELEELKSDNEITQKRLEDLRNARTAWRDAGKELTDALSATNDQIEQQSQLSSSILQQLGEMVRAIFR